MKYYPAIKREIMPLVATWADLPIIILSEVSQTEKDKYHRISLICELFRKMIQMNLITKQKQTQRFQNQTYCYKKGNTAERNKLGVWD